MRNVVKPFVIMPVRDETEVKKDRKKERKKYMKQNMRRKKATAQEVMRKHMER